LSYTTGKNRTYPVAMAGADLEQTGLGVFFFKQVVVWKFNSGIIRAGQKTCCLAKAIATGDTPTLWLGRGGGLASSALFRLIGKFIRGSCVDEGNM